MSRTEAKPRSGRGCASILPARLASPIALLVFLVLVARAAQAQPTVLIVNESGKPALLETARSRVEEAGFTKVRAKASPKRSDASRVYAVEERESEAGQLAAQLGILESVRPKKKAGHPQIVIVIGQDWQPPAQPLTTQDEQPRVRKEKDPPAKTGPWTAGVSVGFAPAGRLRKNDVEDERKTTLKQGMDVGSELFIERALKKSVSAGFSIDALWTLHVESNDRFEEAPSSSLGQHIMFTPYARFRYEIHRGFGAFLRGGAGGTYFRSQADATSPAVGFSGTMGLGGFFQPRNTGWQLLAEVSIQLSRFYPEIINDWLFYYGQARGGIAYRF